MAPNRDDEAAALEFPILIGDIGGTNARFAMVMDADSEPGEPQIVQTANSRPSMTPSGPPCSTGSRSGRARQCSPSPARSMATRSR